MLWITLFLLTELSDSTFQVHTNYARSDKEMIAPYSMDYDQSGRLYLLDRLAARVHVWQPGGAYAKPFGSEGQGPGEMVHPTQLAVAYGRVWVWGYDRKIHVFDLEGQFEWTSKLGHWLPKSMGIINENNLLVGIREARSAKIHMTFYKVQLDNKSHRQLRTFPNHGFLDSNPAYRGPGEIKAFPPDTDIQRGPDGTLYYGFSQNQTIYRIDADGGQIEELVFPIPTSKPKADDIEHVKNMSFPSPAGGRFSFKDFPDTRINFNFDKAYYTHFLVQENRILFVLTPTGSMTDLNNGYAKASYHVFDRKTRKHLHRGAYELPEDSLVYYRNGKVLAITYDEAGSYVIRGVILRGMEEWSTMANSRVSKSAN